MTEMQMGVQLMGYGLFGTFTVLIIFIGAIKLLTVIMPHNDDDSK